MQRAEIVETGRENTDFSTTDAALLGSRPPVHSPRPDLYEQSSCRLDIPGFDCFGFLRVLNYEELLRLVLDLSW